MADSEPTILVVDDDPSVLTSVRRLLASDGKRVETFAHLGELLRSPRCGGPGCLVLDVGLPGLSGLELYQLLRDADCEMPAVFITGLADVPTSVRAMKAGAVDVLSKPFADVDLLDAVERALEADRAAPRERTERLALERRLAALTPREREVFALVSIGMLNKQAAGALGTSEKTVKVHRARVMEKMGAGSLAGLVRMAQRLEVDGAAPPLTARRLALTVAH
ncbi:MAG: response regulator transcription factor [Gemmatimonadaceae bacterium]